MTKRQRDLLRNALELGVTSSHPNIVQVRLAGVWGRFWCCCRWWWISFGVVAVLRWSALGS